MNPGSHRDLAKSTPMTKTVTAPPAPPKPTRSPKATPKTTPFDETDGDEEEVSANPMHGKSMTRFSIFPDENPMRLSGENPMRMSNQSSQDEKRDGAQDEEKRDGAQDPADA